MHYLIDRMKKLSLFVLIFFCITVAVSFAENPRGRLTYYDEYNEITVYDFTGKKIDRIYMGYPLLIGYAVETGATAAEIELEPNGSIIKMKEDSFLKIEELMGTKNGKSNRFALVRGFFRIVAAKLFGTNYSVKTPSTVLGVRGTDFAVSAARDGKTEVFIKEGLVDVFNPATGEVALLGPGDAANVREHVIDRIEYEMEEVRKRIDEFDFLRLAPERVPRRAPKDYYIAFDYFKDIEYREFKEFFEGENYFADSDEYLEKFRGYYRDEMADFEERFSEEKQSFKEYMQNEWEQFKRY